jgi:hypothetical protein
MWGLFVPRRSIKKTITRTNQILGKFYMRDGLPVFRRGWGQRQFESCDDTWKIRVGRHHCVGVVNLHDAVVGCYC